MEKTLAIIKPDATERNIIGKIISMIEADGFMIVRISSMKMTQDRAQKFYDIHTSKPFFNFDFCGNTLAPPKIAADVVEVNFPYV